jgi:hypothetical protein
VNLVHLVNPVKKLFSGLSDPARLGLFLVVLTLGGAVRAADVVDNWSFLEPGVLPKVSSFAVGESLIELNGLKAGGVVDASSTPANPFSDSTRALSIEPGPENGRLRIFTRPFPNETPAQGFYEFTFRLVDGGFNLNPEFFSGPADPKGVWFKSATEEQLFGLAFLPGQPIFIAKQRVGTDEVKVLATEENYTFRIAWETSGENLVFSMFLNGQPLRTGDGTNFSFPVPQSKIADTVLGFRLASGSADGPCFKGFIGRIHAEALSP